MANVTLNGSDKSANITLTGSNLIATATSSGVGYARATGGQITGKFYFEFKPTVWVGASTGGGITLDPAMLASPNGNVPAGIFMVYKSGAIWYDNANTGSSLGARAANDVFSVAIDFDARLGWIRVAPSGNWNGNASADPATGVGGINIYYFGKGIPGYPVVSTNANLDSITVNFGDSAFTGTVPSGFTSGFTSGATWPLNAIATQEALEEWTSTADACMTQIALEQWVNSASGNVQALMTQLALEHWTSVADAGSGGGSNTRAMILA